MNEDILAGRAKGFFPLSIGTSVALEALFNLQTPTHEKKKTDPYKKYDCVCINVATLVRNMCNSVKISDLINVSKESFVNSINNEIVIIQQVFEEYGKGRIICCFYRNRYEKMKKYLKDVQFKKPTTVNQQTLLDLEISIPLLVRCQPENLMEDSDLYITHGRRNNLLLTHVPFDLLFNSLSSVSLLESHTGKIKTPSEFNSKLKNAPDTMPFNKITIQVYGDKGGIIIPMGSKIRTLFTQEANSAGVNASMNEDRFIDKMKKVKEPEIRSIMMRLK